MILAISTGGTVLFSIIVFLLVILILVGSLLYARDKLAPKGKVMVDINDREISVSPGSNLLSTLSGNGIFLPRRP
jgi:Na+-transporting NADH:ubiquinone oxidoreductase subunit F